jgi:NACHT domain
MLNRLPYATKAPFNALNTPSDLTCHPNTRVDLLRDIFAWADRNDEQFIFWLNGLAGTGKSTIARTVARTHFEKGRLGASFFFSRGGGDVGRADKFITTIAKQLAIRIPSIQRAMCAAIKDNRDVANHALGDQWRQLILRPLSKLSYASPSYILVIDALDECEDNGNIHTILKLLAEARSLDVVRI